MRKMFIIFMIFLVTDEEHLISKCFETKSAPSGKRLPNPKRRNTLSPTSIPMSELLYQTEIGNAKTQQVQIAITFCMIMAFAESKLQKYV